MAIPYQGSKLQKDLGIIPPSGGYPGSKLQQDIDQQSKIYKRPTGNSGGGGGSGILGGAPQSSGSSTVVATEKSPTGYTDLLGQPMSVQTTYTPVYKGGILLGFQGSSGQFIPKEAALTSEGLYKPEQVKFIKSQPISNVSGGKVTYYQTPTGGTLQTIKGEQGAQYRVTGGAQQVTYKSSQALEKERPIYDAQGNVVGIESSYFQRTIPINEYERMVEALPELRYYSPTKQATYQTKQIAFKDKDLELTTTPYRVYTTSSGQMIGDVEAYLREQNIFLPKGNEKIDLQDFLKEPPIITEQAANIISTDYLIKSGQLQSGYASTAEDVVQTLASGIVGGAKTAAILGIAKPITPAQTSALLRGALITTPSFMFSTPITQFENRIIDKIVPPSETGFAIGGAPSQIARGAIFLGASPITGEAYLSEIVKGTIISPIGTTKGFYQYAKKSPYEFAVISGYGVLKFGGETFGLARTYFSKEYRGVTKSALGEQIIKAVEVLPGEKVDIGLIPKRGTKLDIDASKFVSEYGIKSAKDAKQPIGLTAQQLAFIDIGKQAGGLFSGSFVLKVLYGKAARPFGDIDYVIRKPKEFARRFGANYETVGLGFETATKGLSPKLSEIGELAGKDIKLTEITMGKTKGLIKLEGEGLKVDIVPPSMYSEVRFLGVGRIKTSQAAGLKIVSPELLLKNKALILGDTILKPEMKIKFDKAITDIKVIAEKDFVLDFDKATLTGAYGYSAKYQAQYLGKTGILATSARDFFKLFERERKVLDVEGKGYYLYATPFDIKTGMPMTRVSRLVLEQRPARISDILKGDVTLKRQKPQIILFKEKIGDLFKPTGKSTELEVATFKPASSQGALKGFTIARTIVKRKPVEIFYGEFVSLSDANIGKLAGFTSSFKSFLTEKRASSGGTPRQEIISMGDYRPYLSPYYLLTGGKTRFKLPSKVSSERIGIKSIDRYSLPSYRQRITSPISVSRTISRERTSEQGSTYGISERELSRSIGISNVSPEPRLPRISRVTRPERVNYPLRTVPKTFSSPKLLRAKEEKPIAKSSKAYSLLIKRKGKYIPIAQGLPKGLALRELQGKLTQNIARSGKLVESGTTTMQDIDFRPSEQIFRGYKIRGGNRIYEPDLFIQKTQANLQFKAEQQSLAESRALARMSNYIG